MGGSRLGFAMVGARTDGAADERGRRQPRAADRDRRPVGVTKPVVPHRHGRWRLALLAAGLAVAAPVVTAASPGGPTDRSAPAAGARSGIVSLAPARLVETRPGLTTADGRLQGNGPLGAESVMTVPVLGRGGVPVDGVAAVMLNVTAVNPAGPGYLTVFPCGVERPTASNVNYSAGQTVPNAVFADVGDGGAVCVYSLAGTDLVIDVNGYGPTGSQVTPLTPARLLDSRDGGGGRFAGNQSIRVTVLGRGGVPADDVDAVLLNVTAVDPEWAGYLTVYPCGTGHPLHRTSTTHRATWCRTPYSPRWVQAARCACSHLRPHTW